MRDVRRDYGKGSPIEVKDLGNPLELLSRWMQDAIDGGVTEPNAMNIATVDSNCLLYTSPSPRDLSTSRMPSSA